MVKGKTKSKLILKRGKIPLYWHQSSNLGDGLSPYIVEKVSGKKVIWHDQSPEQITYVCVGSLLDRYTSYSIIWGAGFASKEHTPSNCYQICAVRGKLTRQKYLDAGINCPPVYGDPCLLMPDFYSPKVEKKYKLGIIPHAIERKLVSDMIGYYDEQLLADGIKVIDIMQGDNLNCIKEILSCESVVSSALHGLVICHAYGIPCYHIQFSDMVVGGKFKFYDYYDSIGVPYTSMFVEDIVRDIEILKGLPVENKLKWDKKAFLDACPFKK